jgi:hypothetical protein
MCAQSFGRKVKGDFPWKDAANREAVRCVERANLNLVGIAIRAERKAVDKIVDRLKFHE